MLRKFRLIRISRGLGTELISAVVGEYKSLTRITLRCLRVHARVHSPGMQSRRVAADFARTS